MIELHCRPAGEPASAIRIGRGIFSQLPKWLGERQAFVYRDPAIATDRPAGLSSPQLVAPVGEAGKTLAQCERLLRAMVAAGLDRKGLLVAIGGGAVGDTAGLAASLFLRGIELWSCPTTLLAMVDSAVGGKTAVNLPEGKNLVGAVHPASLVVVDVDFTATLPEPEFRSGLAEVVKMAIGRDGELFALLERQRERVLARDPAVLLEVVARSLSAKIAIVERDLHEAGDRRLLNLGHTLGHALEAHAAGRLPHGLCVARGLHFAVELAVAERQLDPVDAARCTRLLSAYDFARDPLPPTAGLAPFLRRDKKVEGGEVHFVMPIGIGASTARRLPIARLIEQLERG